MTFARRLRRAIEAGEFDELAGTDKPLTLDQNASTDPDRRMVFHGTRPGELVPDLVQLGNEIESADDATRMDGERHMRRMRQARNRILNDPGMDSRRQPSTPQKSHRGFPVRTRTRLAALRQRFERFSWIAPDSAARSAARVEPKTRATDRAWRWPVPRG